MNNLKERRFAHKLQEKLPGDHVDFQRVSFIFTAQNEEAVYMASQHFNGRGIVKKLKGIDVYISLDILYRY